MNFFCVVFRSSEELGYIVCEKLSRTSSQSVGRRMYNKSLRWSEARYLYFSLVCAFRYNLYKKVSFWKDFFCEVVHFMLFFTQASYISCTVEVILFKSKDFWSQLADTIASVWSNMASFVLLMSKDLIMVTWQK